MKRIINFLFSVYHWKMSLFGALIYGFPSRKIKVIGVTGTKGKSTTLALLSDILEKSGQKTALISSVTVKIADNIEKNRIGNSMPGRFFLQRFLAQAIKAGCDVALMEVTSQGIIQHRHKFIFWDKAVFLNIHPEHIEAHGSFENYLKAKLAFFKYVSCHHNFKESELFVQTEDEHARDFIKAAGNFPVVKFSGGDVNLLKIKLPQSLDADFMKINVAAAIAVADSLGVSKSDIKNAIENFPGVEGRMDTVVLTPFMVVVDYAHTPDSLEVVYKYMSSKKRKGGKMICVLGSAGGGRDRWKRPVLGKIAAQYCDKLVLTDEDPYDEEPALIIGGIEMGYLENKGKTSNLEKILDRSEAIERAIFLAKAGDIVICTGKGSEEAIHLAKGEKIPWSEKKKILQLMSKL
jgi:UDP-N-acetylmuramyl-tripeptide synthetase